MIKPIFIGDRYVGPGNECFVIAEAGVNHNGKMTLAYRLIDAAFDAGANAIKFQSYFTEDLVTPEAQKAKYQLRSTDKKTSGQYKMLKALELTAEQQSKIKAYCDQLGIMYLCTPYDHNSIDLLDTLDVAAFKIASTDTTNIPMLRYIASKNRPVMLSTGMCTLGEVELAVTSLREAGLQDKLVLLQCTAEYPSPMVEVNLRAMHTMERAFVCPVGFSDHTPGIGASPWAVVLGACIVEKHFTLDRTMQGPDHQASVEPHEFKQLVNMIREIESSLGDGIKRPMPSEIDNKKRMQKSLVARKKIMAGEIICGENLTCKRPGTGLPPVWFDRVVGKPAAKDIEMDTLLTIDSIKWD